MTLSQVVIDLVKSSQLGAFGGISPLLFQVGEHAFVAQPSETGSARTGLSSAT